MSGKVDQRDLIDQHEVIRRLEERIEVLAAALGHARSVLAYVSAGRRYVDVGGPYPDAKARSVLAMLDAALAYEGEPSGLYTEVDAP